MKVFVYGTLKQGYHNHGRLGHKPIYLGTRKTLKNYTMFDAGFPVIFEDLPDKYPRKQISGELYQVTGETMKVLDILEVNGKMYNRKLIPVYGHMYAASEQVWMYFGDPGFWEDNQWQPEDAIEHWPA